MLGLRPFDVQLIGGMILHEGQIAEMRTGEGKTLVAVLPAFLNALSGAASRGWSGCAHALAPWWQGLSHANTLALLVSWVGAPPLLSI